MSINKYSIIRLITLFFVLIFILMNGLFWIALEHFAREYEAQQHHRLHFVLHDRTLLEHQPNPMFMPPPPPPPPPSLSTTLKSPELLPIFGVFLTIDLLMLAFFAYLLKKLLPLHRLKNAIINFQEGDTHLDVPILGKDEISQITNEFNHALEKIASMKEARALFLRNILHELKTPIMKGSLTTDCLDRSEDQERLQRIFSRMNYLLGEFSTMERFSSGEMTINPQEYRFVDILDHTCDILMCDKKNITIKGEDSELIVNVDFELFAIALKNLLDNAFKYSDTKPTLIILSNAIEICSVGEPLSDEKRSFTKPFNRKYESSMTGLGLGLYITNAILQKQEYTLSYTHNIGLNCFRMVLSSQRYNKKKS